MTVAARASRTGWVPLAGVLVAWAIAVIVANLFGNFPLFDDWCYATSARAFAATLTFKPCGYEQAASLLHVVTGGFLAHVTHFSFDVLRVSTLTLAAIG